LGNNFQEPAKMGFNFKKKMNLNNRLVVGAKLPPAASNAQAAPRGMGSGSLTLLHHRNCITPNSFGDRTDC
jgi:hypothetical protein